MDVVKVVNLENEITCFYGKHNVNFWKTITDNAREKKWNFYEELVNSYIDSIEINDECVWENPKTK